MTLWGPFCNHYLTVDHIDSMSVDRFGERGCQLRFSWRPNFGTFVFFPHSLTSSVPHVFALSLNERLNLLPLPQSIPPAVSTPTLASLHTDPAGHNDDKSAQIFMSIEIHFGSAHSSLSVLSFFFFYASLFIGHRTCSQTIIITLLKTPQARYIT